ncbi:YceG family protein [Alkaliphilus transvaalensis]|uniref:YceG family protein n=1 Tax=Alkaliphilus transvaalensis TaxID=114628 RepID=UPI000686F370|nr:YceG family protein [Alkaliphilus transvaalensis]
MEEKKPKVSKINIVKGITATPYRDIFLPTKDRDGYFEGEGEISIPVYFYRIIGIDETHSYEDDLFNLHQGLLELDHLYLKFEDGLESYVPNSFIEQKRDQIDFNSLEEIKAEKNFSKATTIQRLAILCPYKNKMIEDKITEILNLYISQYPQVEVVKNFYIKLLYWIEKYIISQVKNLQYGEESPKVLFYGDIRRDEVFFLIFLSLLGWDILYINPLEEGGFSSIANIEDYANLLEYPKRGIIKEFASIEKNKRKETIAYKASVEISQIIHSEGSGIYKPWQFEDYEVKAIPLKTTFEELFILWKEEARFREGFKVENKRISIPTIFAKVSGVSRDMDQYWNYFNALLEKKENMILLERVPFISIPTPQVDYSLFNRDGSLNLEKVKGLRENQFKYLKSSVQDLIFNTINYMVTTNLFIEPLTEAFKIKILYTILSIHKSYLELLQKFDFPFDVPKIVVFDKDKDRFSKEFTIILCFLHLVGFDIVIYTPTGYNNIENGLNKSYYDLHKLEDLNFNLNYMGKKFQQQENGSLLKKGFLWFFQ